jgi:hypothetical protein
MPFWVTLGVVVVILGSALACVVPNLDSEHFTRTEPDPADLAGVYKPTESAWRLIIGEGGYERQDTKVTLADSGVFTMTWMPDWWIDPFGKPSGGYHSGTGTWSVVPHQTWWDLELTFDSPDPPLGMSSRPLAGEAPSYRIWFYVGDPDSGDVMVFERQHN